MEPAHEIMVLFVLRKLILQKRMRSHPVELDVRFLVGPFVYFHTSCVRTAKALVRLRRCAGLPEPLLVAYVISTIISWAGSIMTFLVHVHENTSTAIEVHWFGSTKQIVGSAQQGCNYHFLQKSLFCIFWCILYLYISCKKLHLGILKLNTKNQYLSYGCKWNHGYAQRKSVVSWVTTLLHKVFFIY